MQRANFWPTGFPMISILLDKAQLPQNPTTISRLYFILRVECVCWCVCMHYLTLFSNGEERWNRSGRKDLTTLYISVCFVFAGFRPYSCIAWWQLLVSALGSLSMAFVFSVEYCNPIFYKLAAVLFQSGACRPYGQVGRRTPCKSMLPKKIVPQ
jgi:hypothetical protein